MHADHITGSGELKKRLRKLAEDSVKSIISFESGAKADIHVKEGDVIQCGEGVKLNVLSTPGICYFVFLYCFTDSLFTLQATQTAVSPTTVPMVLMSSPVMPCSSEVVVGLISSKVITLYRNRITAPHSQ